jgi:hypothetical protein
MKMLNGNDSLVVDQFDIAADSKRRISLRGAKWKHFHVKAFSNGSYLLEPRVLVSPQELPAKTLKALDKAVGNFKKGAVSKPVDLTPFQK